MGVASDQPNRISRELKGTEHRCSHATDLRLHQPGLPLGAAAELDPAT